MFLQVKMSDYYGFASVCLDDEARDWRENIISYRAFCRQNGIRYSQDIGKAIDQQYGDEEDMTAEKRAYLLGKIYELLKK